MAMFNILQNLHPAKATQYVHILRLVWGPKLKAGLGGSNSMCKSFACFAKLLLKKLGKAIHCSFSSSSAKSQLMQKIEIQTGWGGIQNVTTRPLKREMAFCIPEG